MSPILILLFLFLFWIIFYSFTHGMYFAFQGFMRLRYYFKRTMQPGYMAQMSFILSKKNSFYNSLSEKGKRKFENRVIYFIEDIDFLGKDGLIITEEMKILISASAIQLTFGLKKYLFTNYLNILVYPGEFYSAAIGRMVKGGVAKENVIALSWDDFEKGYEIGNDNYNLGLHEMTHALNMEAAYAGKTTRLFRARLAAWRESSKACIEQISKARDKYFRDYATANKDEFFSVCVEYFFESPGEFKERFPSIYHQLSELLNLDPLNKHNNFSYTGYDLNYDYTQQHRKFMARDFFIDNREILIFLPAFFYIPVYFYSLFNVLVAPSDIFFIFIVTFIIGFIPYLYLKKYELPLKDYLIFDLASLVPLVFGFLLFINFFSVGKEEQISSYIINKKDTQSYNNEKISLHFANEQLESCLFSNYLHFKIDNYTNSDSVVYVYQKGLVGIPIITKIHVYGSYLVNGDMKIYHYTSDP